MISDGTGVSIVKTNNNEEDIFGRLNEAFVNGEFSVAIYKGKGTEETIAVGNASAPVIVFLLIKELAKHVCKTAKMYEADINKLADLIGGAATQEMKDCWSEYYNDKQGKAD